MQLMSGTIQQSPADAYGRWCRGKLLQCFKNVSVTSGNRFVIDYRPARTHWPITVDGSGGGGGDADADADNESAMTYYLTVISDEVWPWFHLLPSVRGALEFCVAMGYMELRAASDRSTDTDQQAVIAKLSALFEVEESFGGALLPRALVAMRKFVFHGESRGNFIDRQCSLTETFYGLLLLVFSLTISLLMDLITRWHAGYEPAFWSQWRRYRLLTKSK
jgi:hypothetical protein